MEGASVEELHASATENGGGTLGPKTSTCRSALGRYVELHIMAVTGPSRRARRPGRKSSEINVGFRPKGDITDTDNAPFQR